MKNQILKKIYRVVLYLRLSSEDGDSRESDSISNQRILTRGYLDGKSEFVIVREFVDDGFTGTNFDRPDFQEMMRYLEEGKADCIVCKDLSRFGRDFSGVLQYVERILPQMGIRLILVNDNYDSNFPNHDFITLRMKSLINDIYPADTSRSVRANLLAKMTDGQCVAAFAFYGYMKSPEDKHKLVIDPVAGAVVQDIYHLKLKGYSFSGIAEILNLRGILPPLAYKQLYLGQNLKTGFQTKGKSRWEATMVRRILMDERYTGVLLQGRTTTPNHKVKRIIHKPEDEWVRVENAFEGLIDKYTFMVVANLLERDTRKSAGGMALLSGLVECGDCHQNMVRKSPDSRNYYYVCSTSLYEKECTSHSISEKRLIPIIKKCVQIYIAKIVELDAVLRHVQTRSVPKQKILEADKILQVLRQECDRIMKIKKNLYESYCEGLLEEEEFKAYKKTYDEELIQKEAAIKRQQEDILNLSATMDRQQEWMKRILLYKDIEEIDRTVIVVMVKRISIRADKMVSIDFWYEDEYERLRSLLENINQAQPDAVLASFLEDSKEGGDRIA
ncbi:recombinase family protein [Mediterraneibacter glycyrrhizinilyticus]|uniref:recombinase family protein n=1 Tax=Mediterraneibacter glycyrrhizinilyticus TaxID=342942 RepID=UPI00196065A4|nr:recombinase family protein [Mediterraneibacter glycyrrhizinilyticus]MBM6750076.1 recombinase family protein [Mediterraneibacter glycyrrhizinilyticus]